MAWRMIPKQSLRCNFNIIAKYCFRWTRAFNVAQQSIEPPGDLQSNKLSRAQQRSFAVHVAKSQEPGLILIVLTGIKHGFFEARNVCSMLLSANSLWFGFLQAWGIITRRCTKNYVKLVARLFNLDTFLHNTISSLIRSFNRPKPLVLSQLSFALAHGYWYEAW